MTDGEQSSGDGRRKDRPERGDVDDSQPLIPGEIIYGEGPVTINADMPVTTLRVENTADRPIQVGSHYHLSLIHI